MPAISDQVATIEHDLSVALTKVESLFAENGALRNALAALQADHAELQSKHADAAALVEETRKHANDVANAALLMLKVSRPTAGDVKPSEGSKSLAAVPVALVPPNTTITADDIATLKAQGPGVLIPGAWPVKTINAAIDVPASVLDAVNAAVEPERQPVEPEAEPDPAAYQGDSGDEHAPATAPAGFTHCEGCPNPPGCVGACADEKAEPEEPARTVGKDPVLAAPYGAPVTVEAKRAAIEGAHVALQTAHQLPVAPTAPEMTSADRMRGHMHVDDNPLPIFLQKPPLHDAQVFG
ncbi:hypothetical protein [Bradyrhizobium sp. 33ap4]|uniref:hypothetical protein n=1 Tax=Bradyrhizobium sp. 33ap4 TaxID=3061630 RepID=UPI00292E8455|nr:hypothetical protein [Bradyrhizobium sp. 33ap4]